LQHGNACIEDNGEMHGRLETKNSLENHGDGVEDHWEVHLLGTLSHTKVTGALDAPGKNYAVSFSEC
jgi:hypothetical protein